MPPFLGKLDEILLESSSSLGDPPILIVGGMLETIQARQALYCGITLLMIHAIRGFFDGTIQLEIGWVLMLIIAAV